MPDTSLHQLDYTKFVLGNLDNENKQIFLQKHEVHDFYKVIYFEHEQEKKIVLVPPFRYPNTPVYSAQGYFFAFHREYLDEDKKEYALEVFHLFNAHDACTTIRVDEPTGELLNHSYQLLKKEYLHARATYIIITALLKTYLMQLVRYTRHGFLNQDVKQKRVYEFLMLLDKHFIKERQVQFYSAKMGMGEKRLNQIIKLKLGKTVTGLIHHRLILEAKRMLTDNTSTVKEIAFQLRFDDPSYFSRFFKKNTGLSPEDFKKQR